jgi:membrane protein
MPPSARFFLSDLRRAFIAWRARNPALIAAGLAYFSLFSLIPLTVLTIAVVGHFFRGSDASQMVISELSDIFSPEAAQSIALILKRVERSAIPAGAFSVVILMWFGSRLFIYLQIALTAVWDLVPPRSRFGRVKHYLGSRVRAMLATMGFGLLAFIFLLMDVLFAYFRDILIPYIPYELLLKMLPGAALLLSVIVFTLAFATIYRWLPAAHPGWPAVWSGAIVASLLFALGRVAMSFYLHKRNFLSLFGAAGSVVVILIWVYYSMQILLFGAMFASVVGERIQNSNRQETKPPV